MGDCLLPQPWAGITLASLVVWVGLAGLALWVRGQRFFHGKPFFMVMLLGMLWWLGVSILERAATGEACKLFWARALWPGIAVVPAAVAFFLHDYAFGRDGSRTPWKLAALTAGPAAITLAAQTNPLHGLFYGPGTVLVPGPPPAVVYDHGPLFWLSVAYLYLFMLAGIGVALWGALRAHRAYRGFFAAWLAVTLVPVAANLAYVLGGVTLFGMDPSPYSFVFVLAVFTWLIFTNRLFDIRAIAKDILFFATPNPILVVDAAGRVAAANPEAAKVLGGRTGAAVADWPQLGTLAAALGGRARAPRTLEAAGRSFDVEVTPIEKPLDRRALPMGWVVMLRDISARRALERHLQGERDYLSQLMDTSISGILAFDRAGRFIFANAEAERILGQGAADLVGRRHDDPAWGLQTVEGAPLPPSALPTAQVLATGQPVRGARFSFLRPDGVRRVLSVNAAPVTRPDIAAGIVSAIADITDELAAAEALRHARAQAEAASRTKSQFLANMSHEIRTPLNGVLGLAQALEARLDDPEAQAMAATIRDSGEGLLNILNDILDMSKIEAGKLTLEAVPFRPAGLAARIEALHRPGAAARGLRLLAVCGPGCEGVRLGDPHRLRQIAHNLMSNAVKFTEAGAVTLRLAAPPGGPLEMVVQDTGIGMDPAQIARLFEEFEQGENSTARRYGGTGLGMAITRKLVEQMGGTLAVDSAPGRGTEVRVCVPLPEAAPGVPSVTVAEGALQPGTGDDPAAPWRAPVAKAGGAVGARALRGALEGLRLLAADDNATNRMVLAALLKPTGAVLEMVSSGAEACAAWAPGRFDVLLLDIAMPEMDGLEVLATLRARAAAAGLPPPAAVAITANVMPQHLEAYGAAGFVGHAGKPFRAEVLVAAIRAAAANARGTASTPSP